MLNAAPIESTAKRILTAEFCFKSSACLWDCFKMSLQRCQNLAFALKVCLYSTKACV